MPLKLNRKVGQKVLLSGGRLGNTTIEVEVLKVRTNRVELLFDGPEDVHIIRYEKEYEDEEVCPSPRPSDGVRSSHKEEQARMASRDVQSGRRKD